MAKNNAYDEGLYLIGFESGDKVSITEDGCRILGVDDEKSNSARKEPEEVFDVIGGLSDFVDSKGYPTDARLNVIKQIKLKNFVITIQRRQK